MEGVNGEQPCGPVFVLPGRLPGEGSPTAAWITAAGWASGAARRWGHSWLLAPDGPVTAEEARRRAAQPRQNATVHSSRTRHLPTGLATLLKDLRACRDGWRWRTRALNGPWSEQPVPFVWQRHALFERGGRELAAALGCPFVLSVHALQVREAVSWGIRRHGWAAAVERWGERPALFAADLVAAGTEEVASQIRDLGVPAERITVTPNEVDLDHFSFDPAARNQLRHGLRLDGFVLGWVGSFRSFHGLDAAIQAVHAISRYRSDVTLLLVGDGPHRTRLEILVQKLGLERQVRFTGTVTYAQLPSYISTMDAAVMLASKANAFHYSPVKLREYMACSRPIIAHRTGEMARDLRDNETALLVEPSDSGELVEGVLRLANDPRLADRLGRCARRDVAARGGWERPVELVTKALDLM